MKVRLALALLTMSAICSTRFVLAEDLSAELIFQPQSKHVHGSTIVECPNGDLIAAWFHGSGERSADDVVINGARLKKGASEWSPMFLMADTPNIPDCNPVLFIDSKNRLWLFWAVVHTNRWERVILKYRRAEKYDGDGAPEWSWQDIILLRPGKAFQDAQREAFKQIENPAEEMWAEYAQPYSKMLIEAAEDPLKLESGWMTRTRPLELASGRILLPLYSDGFNAGLMAITDDAGETWRASKPIIGLGPIQPTLARRANGEIVSYSRDSGFDPKRVLESVSKDNGESWSIATDNALPNPGSSLALLNLADGKWVLIYNDTEEGRHQLAAAISTDEGKTWSHKKYLEKAEARAGNFGYPTAVQGSDGRIHVSYSHSLKDGATIKYAAFTAEWVMGK